MPLEGAKLRELDEFLEGWEDGGTLEEVRTRFMNGAITVASFRSQAKAAAITSSDVTWHTLVNAVQSKLSVQQTRRT